MSEIAFYVRVSTVDKQDYTRQINDIKRYANIKNENNVEVYADKISGYKKAEERKELQRLIDDCLDKKINSIYVTEISRIARNPRVASDFIYQMIDLKIPIYVETLKQSTLLENGEVNANFMMIIAMVIQFSDIEAKTYKQRVKSGLRQGILNGNVGGGNMIPYGYKKGLNKKLVKNEKEAKTIRLIFNLYEKNYGIKAISNRLNNSNVKTRTNIIFDVTPNKKNAKENTKWSDKQIHDILKNTLYYGDRKYKDEVYKVEEIITKEQWQKCENIRLNKTHRNYLTEYTYLLKDLLICGCCGRNYFAKYKPIIGGDKVYICSSRLIKNGSCGSLGVNISLLESTIYAELITTDKLIKYINKKDDVKQSLEQKLLDLKIEIEIENNNNNDIKAQQKRLLDGYSKGIIKNEILYQNKDDELSKDIDLSDNRIKKITNEIKKINDSIKTIKSLKYTKDKLSNLKEDREQLRQIFKQFISKIQCYSIDKKTFVVLVNIAIEDVILDDKLMIILNKGGMYSNPKKYEYSTLIMQKNIDYLDYEQRLSKINNQLNWFYGTDKEFKIIDNENVLEINKRD